MSVQSGNDVQVALGRRLAQIRVDVLKLRNNDLSRVLTEHTGERITASRISEAEHGRANLGVEYPELLLGYVREVQPKAWEVLSIDSELSSLIDRLPEVKMKHHSNAGQEGNSTHGPKSPPIATMLAKRKQRKLEAKGEPSFSVTFEGGAMVLTTPDFRITVEQV